MKIEESIAYKENGYFTVEAALVLPIVLGVNLLIIYMLFFQYDRCLLEFDIGIVILRGVNLQTENKDELQRQINSLAKSIDWERYIAWETDKLYTKVEGTDITVQGSGRLCFPFAE
ncbi:MAG: hypothetical protein IJF07_08950, partial [Lachnospiraceae bacterium]|nr:hypothetical protein [Lachnospiraceae bacterium]